MRDDLNWRRNGKNNSKNQRSKIKTQTRSTLDLVRPRRRGLSLEGAERWRRGGGGLEQPEEVGSGGARGGREWEKGLRTSFDANVEGRRGEEIQLLE